MKSLSDPEVSRSWPKTRMATLWNFSNPRAAQQPAETFGRRRGLSGRCPLTPGAGPTMSKRQPALSMPKTMYAGAVALIVMIACAGQAVPERPAGVPHEAVWAGGPDGGAWIACRFTPKEQYAG